MSDEKKRLLEYGLIALSLILALVGSFFGIKLPYPTLPDTAPVAAERGITGTLSGDIAVDGALAVGGDATVGGGMTVAGTLTTGGLSDGEKTVWEGTTADAYETTLSITDPTADRTVVLPNESGAVVVSSLATNATDAANSVTGQSNALRFEGASVDAYETIVTPTDPTADRTITLPNVTGTVMLTQNPGIMVLGVNTITTTLTIQHGLTTPQAAFCTLIQDSEANAATCSATISSSTVVVKVWKADGATPGSVGKQVSWMVTGQP